MAFCKNVCTQCDGKIFDQDVRAHPVLGVIVCSPCYQSYLQVGDLSQYRNGVDNDGQDNYCRWCLDGGDLILCNDIRCRNGFCDNCIIRNFGAQHKDAVKNSSDWYCFVCNYSQIDHLRMSLDKPERARVEPTTNGKEFTTDSTTKPTTESTTKLTTRPTNESTTKPTTEPTNRPTTEPTNRPTTESTTKPANETTTKLTTESTTKPATESTTKPANESINRPTTESTTKSAIESTAKQTTKTTNKRPLKPDYRLFSTSNLFNPHKIQKSATPAPKPAVPTTPTVPATPTAPTAKPAAPATAPVAPATPTVPTTTPAAPTTPAGPKTTPAAPTTPTVPATTPAKLTTATPIYHISASFKPTTAPVEPAVASSKFTVTATPKTTPTLANTTTTQPEITAAAAAKSATINFAAIEKELDISDNESDDYVEAQEKFPDATRTPVDSNDVEMTNAEIIKLDEAAKETADSTNQDIEIVLALDAHTSKNTEEDNQTSPMTTWMMRDAIVIKERLDGLSKALLMSLKSFDENRFKKEPLHLLSWKNNLVAFLEQSPQLIGRCSHLDDYLPYINERNNKDM